MEFKDTVKNARKKLEVQMESAMLSKKEPGREVATITGKEKSKAQATLEKREHLCVPIVEAHEAYRKHFKETLNRNHEDRVAERGTQFFESLLSCAYNCSFDSRNDNSGRKSRRKKLKRSCQHGKKKVKYDDLIPPIDPSISTLCSISSCHTVLAPLPATERCFTCACTSDVLSSSCVYEKVCKTLTHGGGAVRNFHYRISRSRRAPNISRSRRASNISRSRRAPHSLLSRRAQDPQIRTAPL